MDNALNRVKENIEKVLVGQGRTIDLLLTALLSGGHVLIEDVPGMGKTVMARSLAKSVSAEFGRVQFTPDLLPSDVTGLSFFNQQEGRFVFSPGPVFCNILLADEINRATPRTQASLLECMAENQVTIDGVTRNLEPPFFVIATQNPVETLGTYPLPEAQLDRFLMRISMAPPNLEQQVAILERFRDDEPLLSLEPVCGKEDIVRLQGEARKIHASKALLGYIAAIVGASHGFRNVELGISPRGALALLRASQSFALLSGREFVTPEDVKAVAAPVLAHRLSVSGASVSSEAQISVVDDLLRAVTVPTEDWEK